MGKKVDNVTILHGYAETPAKVWLPWIGKKLEKAGVSVLVPELPNPLRPDFKDWLKAVEPAARRWNRSSVVIGHSLGGVLALRALERFTDRKVRGIITVATPFASTVRVKELLNFFDREIGWWKLSRKADNFTFIQAKNDPVVPYDHALRYKEALDGKLVLVERGSHFIGRSAEPVWKELRSLLRG
ncbi:hypothetical protein AMJ57_04480 [Parcubacteria bacterium SG8_24]|nr:MAG: hypothetical protein AMJ57_04480 [Parcubacteria bacterium SG8_24]